MVAYNKKSPIELICKPRRSVDWYTSYIWNIRDQIYQIENGKIRKKLTEYEIVLSKTTDKASLIYYRLKKMKNRLEKRKEKKLIET